MRRGSEAAHLRTKTGIATCDGVSCRNERKRERVAQTGERRSDGQKRRREGEKGTGGEREGGYCERCRMNGSRLGAAEGIGKKARRSARRLAATHGAAAGSGAVAHRTSTNLVELELERLDLAARDDA